ncbi:Protein of unknown function [Gryllus bimaculatus]|nr:Protein of unknown function [Gryllus bimaculatus]
MGDLCLGKQYKLDSSENFDEIMKALVNTQSRTSCANRLRFSRSRNNGFASTVSVTIKQNIVGLFLFNS